MKGALSAILIVLVVVLVTLFFIKKGSDPEKPQTPQKDPIVAEHSIVTELPEETSLLAMAPSLEKLYELLKLEDDAILGYDISEYVNEMKEELELNLLSMDELKGKGVDGNKEIGFYITDLSEVVADEPKGAGTIFIPLTNDASLKSFLLKKLKDEDLTITEKENYTLVYEEGEDFAVTLAQKGDYLFITAGINEKRVTEEIELLLNGKKKLAESETYKNALKGLKGGGTAFAYVNMSLLSDIYGEIFEKYNRTMGALSSFSMNSESLINMMKASQGFSCWLDISGEDLIVRSVGTLNRDNVLTKCFKSNTLVSPVYNISKKPVLLTSQTLDFETYLKEYIKVYNITESQVEEFFAEALKETGIDLKTNLYENLGQHIGFGIYDASTINMGTYNMLIAIEMKDKAKGEILLSEITKKVKAELKNAGGMMGMATTVEPVTIKGVKATQIAFPMTFRLFYGMHNNTLLIASERALFEEAITGSLDSGFIKDLSDADLKALFTPQANSIGYLDIDGLATVIENFKSSIALAMAAMDPSSSQKVTTLITGIADEIRKMNYISGATLLEDDRITSTMRINTDYGVPFVEGTNAMVQNIKDLIEKNK